LFKTKARILRRFLYILSPLFVTGNLLAHQPHKVKPEVNTHYFVENKGQWPEEILFRAEIPQGNVLITNKGITYQIISHELEPSKFYSTEPTNPHASNSLKKIKGQVIKVSFAHCQPDFQFQKLKPTKAHFQFLKGNNPEKWVQGARAWQEIVFQQLYEGIDLKLYFKQGILKYDFVVQPGFDPNQIAIRYEGADNLSVKDQSLVVSTSLGNIYEKPPFSFQKTEKGIKEVPCHFVVQNNEVKFKIGNYDDEKPLIIDPELIFSTYSGSRADNWGNTATFDEAGNFYSGGIVFGDGNFPVTAGTFGQYAGGNMDILILKYSPDGKNLLFAAYVGGSDVEVPISLIVNHKNELIILGITGSADFPITSNAFDPTFNGGIPQGDAFYNFDATPIPGATIEYALPSGTDIFLLILNADSNLLVASTYLGGDDNDGVIKGLTPPVKNYGDQLRGEVVVDEQDNIYIASHTYSDTLAGVPSIVGANRDSLDAIVAKFSPQLDTLKWLHWHGGSDHDSGFGIRADTLNQVFVTGSTSSNDLFQIPTSGIHPSYMGNIDGYILKLRASDGTPIDGTFIGTADFDQCYFLDLDDNNDVYVFGLTNGNYPVSANVYSNIDGGQFIHKLSSDLTTTIFSTRFGSGKRNGLGEIVPDISPTAFMVNNCRKIFLSGWGGAVNPDAQTIGYRNQFNQPRSFLYVTGYTGGNILGMPVSNDAFQSTTNGTGFYFMILQPNASSLGYATYFGGTVNNYEHVDGGTSRFSKKGVIYQSVCAGCGGQNNFPTPIPGVWSLTNNSPNCNNGSLKFDLGKVIARFETFDSLKAIPSQYGCTPITFLIKNKSTGATNYKWEVGTGVVTLKDDSIFIKFSQRGFQKITLIAFDTSICKISDTARSYVNAGDVRVDFPPDIRQCGLTPVNPNVQLYTPWAKVKWTPPDGLSSDTIANPLISSIGKDTVYYISVTDDTLCMKFDTLSVKIRDPNPTARFIVMDTNKIAEKYSFCYPNKGFIKSRSTYNDYSYWKEDNNLLFFGVDSFYRDFPKLDKTTFEHFVFDSVCMKGSTVKKIVTLSKPLPIYPNDTSVCIKDFIHARVIGDPTFTYAWSPGKLFIDSTSQFQTFFPSNGNSVKITVTDTIGCTDSHIYNFNVFTTEDPIADKELIFCRRKTDGVELTSIPMNSYLWLPSGAGYNPFKVSEPGVYYFQGKDLHGCYIKDTITVLEHCEPELHVPTAFSPNGDGQNDFFQVFGHDIASFDIKIFNRWGELIFHSNDFRFQWDGKYKSEIIPIETYPYIISYKGTKFKDQELSKTFSGDVTVVR
jgi:gliding motility-associated-like protein